ncbi:hypothetical protein JXD20_00685 [Candidatus Peregrinibacteria bacterium]|nr:hypothetical protein [Candidatus Peregrinibacteria bacterium]
MTDHFVRRGAVQVIFRELRGETKPMRYTYLILAFVAFTLFSGLAFAQPANPWGGPSKRSTPAADATDDADDIDVVPAPDFTPLPRKAVYPKRDCDFGKDDEGHCRTFEQVVTETAEAKARAEALERENSLLWSLVMVISLILLVGTAYEFIQKERRLRNAEERRFVRTVKGHLIPKRDADGNPVRDANGYLVPVTKEATEDGTDK